MTAMTAAMVVLAGGTDLLACPACSSAEEAPLIDAARLGVLVMLGITLAVQGAFAGFFFYLRSSARRAADEELDTEWSELQRPSRTS
jgi:heme/copper-type cytochrome/quinol oxidase subunit 2